MSDTDGQRARLAATQGVDAITVSNALAFGAAWLVDVPREHVNWVPRTLLSVTLALAPAGIVSGVASLLVATLAVATEHPRLGSIVVTNALHAILASEPTVAG